MKINLALLSFFCIYLTQNLSAAQAEFRNITSFPVPGSAIDMSPDGNFFVIGSESGEVRIVESHTGLVMRTFQADPALQRAAWSPDNRYILTLSNKRLILWNNEGEFLKRIEIEYEVDEPWGPREAWHEFLEADMDIVEDEIELEEYFTSMAWSTDGLYLACGGLDGTVYIVRVDQLRQERIISKLAIAIKDLDTATTALAWEPHGPALAIGWDDGALATWDSRTDQLTMLPVPGDNGSDATEYSDMWGDVIGREVGHSDSISSISWFLDGAMRGTRQFATASYDGTARIWDAETGLFQKGWYPEHNELISIAWSPDGRYIASAAAGGSRISIWQHSQTPEHSVDQSFDNVFEIGYDADIDSPVIAWFGDGRLVTTAEREAVFTGQTRIWRWEPHPIQ